MNGAPHEAHTVQLEDRCSGRNRARRRIRWHRTGEPLPRSRLTCPAQVEVETSVEETTPRPPTCPDDSVPDDSVPDDSVPDDSVTGRLGAGRLGDRTTPCRTTPSNPGAMRRSTARHRHKPPTRPPPPHPHRLIPPRRQRSRARHRPTRPPSSHPTHRLSPPRRQRSRARRRPTRQPSSHPTRRLTRPRRQRSRARRRPHAGVGCQPGEPRVAALTTVARDPGEPRDRELICFVDGSTLDPSDARLASGESGVIAWLAPPVAVRMPVSGRRGPAHDRTVRAGDLSVSAPVRDQRT